MITLPEDRTHEQISFLFASNIDIEQASKTLLSVPGVIFIDAVFPGDKDELFSRMFVGGIDKQTKEEVFESIKNLDIIEDVEYFVVRRLKR